MEPESCCQRGGGGGGEEAAARHAASGRQVGLAVAAQGIRYCCQGALESPAGLGQ